jgi:hypothetical protein
MWRSKDDSDDDVAYFEKRCGLKQMGMNDIMT